MTKSRMALFAVATLAAAFSRAAWAQPPATAEQALAEADARFHEMISSAARAHRCDRDGDGAIVVCARQVDNAAYRVPYDPPPGERHRLVAGEAPSAREALSVGQACCGGGGGIDLLGLGAALIQGVGHILHPD
jgi:hypothetical protein